jgi:cysteine-rich repeat protein
MCVQSLIATLVLALLCGGCFETQAQRCGELWCPGGTICMPDHLRCVSPAQLAACSGQQEGDTCRMTGAAESLCTAGVCTPVVCGDGVVAGWEVCDDGNVRACDGCSANCRSDESCGNGMVECSEQCDRGARNSDAPNADCRPDCRVQRCGDHIVDDQSGEDCDGVPSASASCVDYGFYEGNVSCSDACRNDTAACQQKCGDGVSNGPEICDSLWANSQSCLDFGYDVGSLTCSAFCTPSFARCERQGFQPVELWTASAFLYGVSGTGPSDVYAYGQDLILHFDGSMWQQMDTRELATSRDDVNAFLGLWAFARNDAFAVGYLGVIARWDGKVWTHMESGVASTLSGVWGSAPDHVFVVGIDALLHFDGKTWHEQAQPAPDRDYYGVWGAGPANVYATHGTGIDRFDGKKWSKTDAPALGFYGIWGSGARDIFAVGDSGSVAHFDGKTWRLLEQAVTDETLLSVTGSGPDDVYASGDLGTILHYDGTQWTAVRGANNQAVPAVWSAGPDDTYACAGLDILHLDQSGPTLRQMPSGTTEALLNVWMTAPDDVTAVGANGTILQFDGSTWSPQTAASDDDFSDVWGLDAKHKWATGYKYGHVHRYDGETWTLAELPTATPLTSIWGRNARDIYAVGNGGLILHFDGKAWLVEDSGTTNDMSSVFGFADGATYAGSFGGVLLRREDAARWRVVLDEPATDIWALWGTSGEHIVAAADTVAYFVDDGEARALPFGPGILVDALSGAGRDDIFGLPVGAVALYHFDGRDWAPMRVPSGAAALHGIAMGPQRGYIVGVGGTILELDRRCAKREQNCSDRWDNDCDGLANCADPDCVDNRACSDGGACNVAATLACGESYAGSTASGNPVFGVYPCSPRAQTGREVFHELIAEEDGSVTLTLEHEESDLDLIVIGAAVAGGCDVEGACIAASSTLEKTERVTFDARAGDKYYIAVDTPDRLGFAPYTLSVACP